MKIKKSKLFNSISLMLLSILFLIRGIEHQVVVLRIAFLLCSVSFFIGSVGLLYEGRKKF